MSRREPGVPLAIAEALNRREASADAEGRLVLGPLLRIACPTAGALRQVAHGLGVVPDGFLLARATGLVYASGWGEWTPTVATLTAPVANTIAEGRFFVWAVPDQAVDA